jgi:hypothetical protein
MLNDPRVNFAISDRGPWPALITSASRWKAEVTTPYLRLF